MSEPIELAIFSKIGGPLTKRITLTADGKIASDGGACTMARGRSVDPDGHSSGRSSTCSRTRAVS